MSVIVAICIISLTGIGDAWYFIEHNSTLPRECPYAEELLRIVQKAANIFVLQAFNASNLLNSLGRLYMNRENTARVNSICSRPFAYTHEQMNYSHVYLCDILVQYIRFNHEHRIPFLSKFCV